MPLPLRLLSPYPAEGHLLVESDQALLHPDHIPGWARALAAQLDEDCGFWQATGRPLLEAALAGDREGQVLIGGEVTWRCGCREVAAVA